MTDAMFTRTALTEAAEKAGVTPDQARTLLEVAGVKVEPEKPALPTEPGSVIIATEVRGVTGEWRLMLDDDEDWSSGERVRGHRWHGPNHITAWTEARVTPVTAAPVALTEDQVGEVWNASKNLRLHRWTATDAPVRGSITATVNAALAQRAAPAEGEPIDPDDVLAGDRVRVEFEDGDEATFTVTWVGVYGPYSRSSAYDFGNMRSVRLLHREEA